jgi:hypothetical protein
MIAAVILIVLALLLAATPWRRLSPVGRLWALAACLNALVFFSMHTIAATSPWRPVVGRVLAASAGMSLGLLLLGLVLRQRQATPSDAGAWLGPLILGALPGVFYAFFWVIGPLY